VTRFAFYLVFVVALVAALTAMVLAASRAAGTPYALPLGAAVAVFGVLMVLRERA
jgi:hypothetical protein